MREDSPYIEGTNPSRVRLTKGNLEARMVENIFSPQRARRRLGEKIHKDSQDHDRI